MFQKGNGYNSPLHDKGFFMGCFHRLGYFDYLSRSHIVLVMNPNFCFQTGTSLTIYSTRWCSKTLNDNFFGYMDVFITLLHCVLCYTKTDSGQRI